MGDFVFGAIVLVIFLALVAAAGVLLYRIKNARFTRAWAPLVPVIGGRIRGDGGGAATSFLVGSYLHHDVEASMSPNAGAVGGVGETSTGVAHNAFEIKLGGVSGRSDWRLLGPRAGTGQWRIDTADEELRQRLAASDLIIRVAALGHPSHAITTVGLPVLRFVSGHAMLHYREDAGPVVVPSAQRFRQELDTLLGVVALNSSVNR